MCVCSTFRPSDFFLFVKNGFVVGVRCQGNSEPPADGETTPLSHFYAWLRNSAWLALHTQYPVQLTNTVYTHGVYWVARQEAGGQRGAGKERGRIEFGRDGGSKGREGERKRWCETGKGRGRIEGGRDGGSKGREGGREGGSDDVRQRGSGSGGRAGRLREG